MNYKIKKAILKRIKRLPLFRVRKSKETIRWGIMGLGNMAEVFATAIDGNKDGVVYAVASRDMNKATTFGKRHNCKHTYGSYENMIYDESIGIDVIYIATPVKYHYDNIKACLKAGKNVLCEKPICSSASQLKELVDLAKSKNCFLMEGMWMKCLPTFIKAKEWETRIGRKELIKVDFYKRERIRSNMTIFNASEGGGVLKDFGVYAISFMESFIGGMPDAICANSRISLLGIDSDWQIYARKEDVQAFVSLSSNFDSLSKASVIGTEGSIEWKSQFNRTNIITLFDKNGITKDSFVTKYDFDGFEYEINEVHKCIKAGLKESQMVTLRDSLNTLSLIDKISIRQA